MVTVGYDQAVRKLAPVDSPFDWDEETSRPPQVPPRDDDGGSES